MLEHKKNDILIAKENAREPESEDETKASLAALLTLDRTRASDCSDISGCRS